MIDFATSPVSVPVSVIDTLSDSDDTLVCVFCDCEVDADAFVCGCCREYKGIMTVSEWESYTGESWE